VSVEIPNKVQVSVSQMQKTQVMIANPMEGDQPDQPKEEEKQD